MPSTARNGFLRVVAAVLRDPDNPTKMLISQRRKGQHLEGAWELPGGKLEPGESPFHGLRRELAEELGIQLMAARPLISTFHRYPERSVLLDVWETRSYLGEPRARESQKLVWVTSDEMDDYEFPAANKAVLKALSLPSQILITPDTEQRHLDSFLSHFEYLIEHHPYRLISFRAHGLDDDAYHNAALQMQAMLKGTQCEIVLQRIDIKSLKAKRFSDFQYRHLNSHQLNAVQKRPFARDYRLSVSCHDAEELRKAERLGSDFAFLSAVRATASHPGMQAKGWYRFRRLAEQARIPVYALGGVARRDLCVARFQGAVGVAGISDFWNIG